MHNRIYSLVIAILLCLLALNVARTGHTTNDDATLSVSTANFSTWQSTKESASTQGRIQFFWGYPSLKVPHLIQSELWYTSVKIFGLVLVVASIYLAVKTIFKSVWLGSFSTITFLLIVQNGWDHNALTSYPFAFNAYLSAFLISITAYFKWIHSRSIYWIIIACALFIYSLAIELFLLFLPAFFLLHFLDVDDKNEFTEGAKRQSAVAELKLLSPVAISAIFYLFLYSLWRLFNPSGYDGNQFSSDPDILDRLRVVFAYSINSIPLNSIDFLDDERQLLQLTGHTSLIEFIRYNSHPIVLKTVVALIATAALFFTKPDSNLSLRTTTYCIAALTVCIFLPNMLLSLTGRHIEWVRNGTRSYLYTYYSVVFFALLMAFTILLTLKVIGNGIIANTFRALLVIIFTTTAFAVEVRNTALFIDQSKSLRKQKTFDKAVFSGILSSIPEHTKIMSQSLSSNHRGIAVLDPKYWMNRSAILTGKRYTFEQGVCAPMSDCISMEFHQADWADFQYIYVVRQAEAGLSSVRIYVHPSFSYRLTVSGEFRETVQTESYMKFRKEVVRIPPSESIFRVDSIEVVPGNSAQYIEFSSDRKIWPESVRVSF